MCGNIKDSTWNISYFFYLNVYSLKLADKKAKKSLKMFHSSSIDQQGVQRILTRNS